MVFPFTQCALCRPQRQAAAAPPGGQTEAAGALDPTQAASVPHMLRSKSEARILRLEVGAPEASGMYRSQSMTLLEASRRRLAAAAAAEAAAEAEQQLVADGTAVKEFVRQYMQAIKDGNASWASAQEVSGLFAEDARMVSADKQSFQGRPSIVRRLNQGVEMLARMAGNSPELPTFELSGPDPAPSSSGGAAGSRSLVLRLAFKRGMHRMAFTMNFSMRAGKIVCLQTTRS